MDAERTMEMDTVPSLRLERDEERRRLPARSFVDLDRLDLDRRREWERFVFLARDTRTDLRLARLARLRLERTERLRLRIRGMAEFILVRIFFEVYVGIKRCMARDTIKDAMESLCKCVVDEMNCQSSSSQIFFQMRSIAASLSLPLSSVKQPRNSS